MPKRAIISWTNYFFSPKTRVLWITYTIFLFPLLTSYETVVKLHKLCLSFLICKVGAPTSCIGC
jgi:hypothetical protein